MDARPKSKRRNTFQPSCEGLESLALLSTLSPGSGAASTPAVTLSATPVASVPTATANGDDHPVGVVAVPAGFQASTLLKTGDFLVTNTENQGRPRKGSTIEAVTTAPAASGTLFFQGQNAEGIGLTGAVGIVGRGLTIVGNVPTTATSTTQLGQAMLTVLDRNGNNVTQIQAPGGPVGIAVHDQGKSVQVFVSNALSGTITRIDMHVFPTKVLILNEVRIASGYAHTSGTSTSTEGPTGLAYNAAKDTLYVTSPGDNMVYAVKQAGSTRKDRGTGQALTADPSHFHGPAGVAVTPSGTLLITNNDTNHADPSQPSELVQYSPDGQFLAQQSISNQLGGAGGIAVRASSRHDLTVAVANDTTNSLDIYHGTD